MARRLISPCQGSGLLNAGFLGVFSSHHYHRLPLSSSHRSSQLKHCYLPNLRKEVSHWTRPATPSLSLYSARLASKRTTCSVATEPPPSTTEEPEMDLPKEIFLKEYKKPDYLFDSVNLEFQLGEDKTIVTSKIAVSPGTEGTSSPLTLHGRDLKLLSIKVNGKDLKVATLVPFYFFSFCYVGSVCLGQGWMFIMSKCGHRP